MTNRKTNLQDHLDEFLAPMGYEVVHMNVSQQQSGNTYQLFIDRLDEERVTLDDCSELSPKIKLELEALGEYDDSTTLEVSSPGVKRRLTKTRHFERFMGRRIKLELLDAGKKKTVTGELQGVDDDELWVGFDSETCDMLESFEVPDEELEPQALRQLVIDRDLVIKCSLVPEI